MRTRCYLILLKKNVPENFRRIFALRFVFSIEIWKIIFTKKMCTKHVALLIIGWRSRCFLYHKSRWLFPPGARLKYHTQAFLFDFFFILFFQFARVSLVRCSHIFFISRILVMAHFCLVLLYITLAKCTQRRWFISRSFAHCFDRVAIFFAYFLL